MEQIIKKNKNKMTTEERLDEVSEQGSEIIETDSSCAEGDQEFINVEDMSPLD